jgi:hypothetical protein
LWLFGFPEEHLDMLARVGRHRTGQHRVKQMAFASNRKS